MALIQKAAGRTAAAHDLLRRAISIDPRNADLVGRVRTRLNTRGG